MKLDHVLLVHSIQGCKTTALVEDVLDSHDIGHTVIHRSRLAQRFFKGNDLVIVVGGDGTLLRTSHFVKDKTPVLGVNCNVKVNEGFFMRANRDNFAGRLLRILKGKNRLLKLHRLEVTLNNKLLPELALNDVFLGDHKSYHVARYWLDNEYQKSSGVIVSTAAGSYSWYKSAGGKPLALGSSKFAFKVREPYTGRLFRPRKLSGILNPGQRLTVRSDIFDGLIVFDSVSQEYKFCCSDTAVIKLSKKPLLLVEF
ncbi:MAG: NAD(+)/NADH kinase [Candidatus Woesearchaeota archaeon]